MVNPYYPIPQPTRSAIPKVMGILMLIFASLGLLGGVIGILNTGGDDLMSMIPELKSWHTIDRIVTFTGVGISGLHLYAGFRAIGYKSNAPRAAVTYAVAAMVVTITNAILVFAWIKPILDDIGGGFGEPNFGAVFGPIMFFTTMVSLAWPIIVLILMTRPGAKAACVNQL